MHSKLRIPLVAALIAALGTSVAATAATTAATASKFVAAGSARQVYATGLKAGDKVELLDRSGDVVATRRVDFLGGVLFRNVAPGTGYRVKELGGPTSKSLTVHSNDPKQWNPSIYKQPIKSDGYGYMTTRDGTKLAYNVWLPTELGGAEGTPGLTAPGGPEYSSPYPTLIEYSGYGYANPNGPTNGIAAVANIMGFAVVDIQMRGTGCSGGAFDFFEPLQSIDAYDIIETFARQPWVKDHKVGMFGISYGGISQLFAAADRPPSLEAISPLSVIDATATTLYPGGIRNDGFAVAWAKERQAEAQPAGQGKKGTQPYAEQQIKNGDTVCKDNQVLHPEAANLMAKIKANSHYKPAIADPLDPVTFVHKINVPVFMACQFEDEQTGGHCPTLAAHMTGTKKKWFTFTNGPHIDSLSPSTYDRLYDFLCIYVAHQSPAQYAAQVNASAPILYQTALGVPQQDWDTLPPDPIQADPTVDQAKSDFEALPEVRILFDNGAGSAPTQTSQTGDPYPQFEQSFKTWPVPGTSAQKLFFGPKGSLGAHAPGSAGTDVFTADAHALPLTDFGKDTGTGGLWGSANQWEWNWKQNPSGTAVSYVSSPLTKDTAVIGAGAVYAWVKSSTPDVDLQATVSEVTPDGHETFVQNGYLRASERKLSYSTNNVMHTPSTLLEPVPTMLASDVAPMPSGKFVRVAIPLYYEGHVYRAGTRIRITIAGVNGAQPIWSFSHTVPSGTSTVTVAHSKSMPSFLVLPVVSGVDAQGTSQPPCPSLRNEPCRDYQPIDNKTESN